MVLDTICTLGCLIRHEPFGKVMVKHDQEEEYGFAFENGCGGTVSTIDWFQRFDLIIIRAAAFETECVEWL